MRHFGATEKEEVQPSYRGVPALHFQENLLAYFPYFEK
jgi:hypothetical protein